jgi:hypothetical protein
MGIVPANFSLKLSPNGELEKPLQIESKSIQNLVRVKFLS